MILDHVGTHRVIQRFIDAIVSMAERLEDVAVKVTGVRSFKDVLASCVVEATQAATDLGIKVEMPTRQALERMF